MVHLCLLNTKLRASNLDRGIWMAYRGSRTVYENYVYGFGPSPERAFLDYLGKQAKEDKLDAFIEGCQHRGLTV